MYSSSPLLAGSSTPPTANASNTHSKTYGKTGRGSSLVIRNVIVEGRRTSIRLEPEMWRSLQEICKRERCTPHDIATMVAAERTQGSLTAALRVFVMVYFRAAATEDGHNTAGHGSGSVLAPLYHHLVQRDQATMPTVSKQQPSNGRF